jgi:hypothetical protein
MVNILNKFRSLWEKMVGAENDGTAAKIGKIKGVSAQRKIKNCSERLLPTECTAKSPAILHFVVW